MLKGRIDRYVMRYIVPFSYKKVGISFEDLCMSITNLSNQMWKLDSITHKDQDIYSYITDLFIEKSGRDNNIGCTWKYNSQGKNVKIAYFPLPSCRDKKVKFDISDIGLFLFRTGVGFLWYEVIFQEKVVDVNQLVEFQNIFKELNRSTNKEVFKQVFSSKPIPINISEDDLLDSEQISLDKRNDYVPCYFRKATKWLSLEKLSNNFDEERDEYYIISNGKEYSIRWTSYRQMNMGDWISELLSSLPCNIDFIPNRTSCMKVDEETSILRRIVPDKAILFQYIVVDYNSEILNLTERKEELIKASYYLTNGYRESFLFESDISREMYSMYQNVCLYATREGCGYYVSKEKINQSFFTGNMIERMKHDYFILYIHLLYQTYTLLHYTCKIEEELSANWEAHQDDTEYADKLEQISAEINVFLVKSVYSSVSFVSQQNMFYEYVENCLRIRNDIQSMTTGLESLEELQQVRKERYLKAQREEEKKRLQEEKAEEEERQQKENDKVSNALGFLSMLSVISAYVDGVGLVDIIKDKWFFSNISENILNGIIVIVVTILAIIVVIAITPSFLRSMRGKRYKK